MAVKERSQIKGTDAQIKAFAGHNGVLAFATDTKSLHVLSGTAGTTTEFLPSNKVATKTELDGKLSLSGGTMTGDIIFSSSLAKIANAKNNGGKVEVSQTGAALLSNQDDFQGGAALLLRSSLYGAGQSGYFYLISALKAGQRYDLVGKPDGSLTWGGHNVISVVAESYSANSWYRKYSDGWIEQGGRSNFPKNETNLVITFPIAFSNAGYTITFCKNAPLSVWLTAQSQTNFTVSRSEQLSDSPGVWWYACHK